MTCCAEAGAYLRECRERSGLTVTDLIEQWGFSQALDIGDLTTWLGQVEAGDVIIQELQFRAWFHQIGADAENYRKLVHGQ